MTIETGVGGIICAAHKDAAGRLHGHTYEVIAWWPDDGRDALALRRKLDAAIALHDHSELGAERCRGEDLAEIIASMLPGCSEVNVNRPAERLYARWRKI
jgi:hypothetical protein